MKNDLPCPACGFETLEDSYGSYVICDVCGWEDDGVQLANPCSNGGANRESLSEAQEKAMAKYPMSVQVTEGFKRNKRWRPLNSREKENYTKQLKEKHWSNKATLYESEVYWNVDS